MKKNSLKFIFPIIKNIIREINLESESEWADRDSIALKLEENEEIKLIYSGLNLDKIDYQRRVGNLVDWFSAHFTKRSNFMDEYLTEFDRIEVKVRSSKGQKRKIYAYTVLTAKIAEEIDTAEVVKFKEGSVKRILVNNYERSISARRACILHHGLNCKVCGFNFKEYYGVIGENYIHVHHLKEISKIGKEYLLDPINDLVPVCANCHSMIHKNEPPFSIEALKLKIDQASK